MCFLAGFAHASPGIVIALYAQLNRTVAFIPAVGNPDAGGSLVLQARRREQNRPQLISPHTSLSAARHRHAHRALDGGRTNALSRLPASERPGPRSLRKFANMENSVGVAQARGERPVHVAPHAPHSLFSLYGFCMSRVQMHSKWARGRARKELIDWGPRGEKRGWPGATWVHIFGLGDFADTGPRDASVPP